MYQYLKRSCTFSQQENSHQEIAHYLMSNGEIFSVAFAHNVIIIIILYRYTDDPQLSRTSVDGGIEKPPAGIHVIADTC
jgi:hypothetical protein